MINWNAELFCEYTDLKYHYIQDMLRHRLVIICNKYDSNTEIAYQLSDALFFNEW